MGSEGSRRVCSRWSRAIHQRARRRVLGHGRRCRPRPRGLRAPTASLAGTSAYRAAARRPLLPPPRAPGRAHHRHRYHGGAGAQRPAPRPASMACCHCCARGHRAKRGRHDLLPSVGLRLSVGRSPPLGLLLALLLVDVRADLGGFLTRVSLVAGREGRRGRPVERTGRRPLRGHAMDISGSETSSAGMRREAVRAPSDRAQGWEKACTRLRMFPAFWSRPCPPAT